MRTEKATKKITQSGDSLVINVTTEVKRLGLGRGDNVDIELSTDQTDKIEFLTRIVNNAIKAHDLKRTGPDTYTADYRTVQKIADSVGDCCGDYVVGLDTSEKRTYLSIFEWVGADCFQLLEITFTDPSPDHD